MVNWGYIHTWGRPKGIKHLQLGSIIGNALVWDEPTMVSFLWLVDGLVWSGVEYHKEVSQESKPQHKPPLKTTGWSVPQHPTTTKNNNNAIQKQITTLETKQTTLCEHLWVAIPTKKKTTPGRERQLIESLGTPVKIAPLWAHTQTSAYYISQYI